jgi:hypothetical protein
MSCPYPDQLGVVFANAYRLGNMNASLFATEGVASVGLIWMPLAALVCGFVFAVTNKVSAGLQPRFILISGAMIPIMLMNVPVSTMLLSNGLALLIVLWWLAPRSSDRQRATIVPWNDEQPESEQLHPAACRTAESMPPGRLPRAQ